MPVALHRHGGPQHALVNPNAWQFSALRDAEVKNCAPDLHSVDHPIAPALAGNTIVLGGFDGNWYEFRHLGALNSRKVATGSKLVSI